MNNKILNKKSPIEKELDHIARREARLTKQAQQYQTARWKENLEQKIPPRVHTNLQTAFCKAFELIFEKGTGLIERHTHAARWSWIFRCTIMQSD